MKDVSKNPEYNNWKFEAGDKFTPLHDKPMKKEPSGNMRFPSLKIQVRFDGEERYVTLTPTQFKQLEDDCARDTKFEAYEYNGKFGKGFIGVRRVKGQSKPLNLSGIELTDEQKDYIPQITEYLKNNSDDGLDESIKEQLGCDLATAQEIIKQSKLSK